MTEELRRIGTNWAESIMSDMTSPILHPCEKVGFYQTVQKAIENKEKLFACDFEEFFSGNKQYQKLDEAQKTAFLDFFVERYEIIKEYIDYLTNQVL